MPNPKQSFVLPVAAAAVVLALAGCHSGSSHPALGSAGSAASGAASTVQAQAPQLKTAAENLAISCVSQQLTPASIPTLISSTGTAARQAAGKAVDACIQTGAQNNPALAQDAHNYLPPEILAMLGEGGQKAQLPTKAQLDQDRTVAEGYMTTCASDELPHLVTDGMHAAGQKVIACFKGDAAKNPTLNFYITAVTPAALKGAVNQGLS